MPRNIPEKTKRRWIELADQGFEPWEIRKTTGTSSDPRTIENVINKERAERASNEIRSRAYVQALAEHWAMLGGSPSGMLDALRRRTSRFADRPPVHALAENRLESEAWTARKKHGEGGWQVELRYFGSVEAESLKEHTGDHPFWRSVDSYSHCLADFIEARLAIARAVVKAVEVATGVELHRIGTTRLEMAGLSSLDETFYRAVSGDQFESDEIESSFEYEQEGRRLVFRGALAVESDSALPGELPRLIAEGLSDLRGGAEWRRAIATTARLDKALDGVEREFALMKTMPALPGICSACRRVA